MLHQPGAAWRYNTGAQVLGIVLERASGQPLEAFLRARLFDPLGMVDTSFSVPAEKAARFTTAYMPMPDESGAAAVLDPGRRWLVERAARDGERGGHARVHPGRLLAFAAMLRAGGRHDGQQLLSPGSVAAMTRDHLSASQREGVRTVPRARLRVGLRDGRTRLRSRASRRGPWGYGWTGGSGTVWYTDPARDLTGILLTTRAMTSPEMPAHFRVFWDGAYGALRD